jgi:hypothetical protein
MVPLEHNSAPLADKAQTLYGERAIADSVPQTIDTFNGKVVQRSEDGFEGGEVAVNVGNKADEHGDGPGDENPAAYGGTGVFESRASE